MRILRCVLFAWVAFGLVSHAMAQGNQTDALIEQASAQYADLNFEAALKLLNKALKAKGNSRVQLVRIHHLTGLCLGAIGNYDIAKQAFARLLTLDPTFRLGADVSPRVRKPFDDLVKRKPQRLEVRPMPPPHAQLGKPLVLTFQVVADPVKMANSVQVWHRRGKQGKYSSIRSKVAGKGEYQITIPPVAWEAGKGMDGGDLSWFAVVEGEQRSQLQNFGDAMHPVSLEVIDQATAEKLAAAEKRWYERWWVWALIGGVVVAGTTTAVVLATTSTPSGPFDFTVDFSTKQP
jgi:tetratricopeptide (TPR) repeat protein